MRLVVPAPNSNFPVVVAEPHPPMKKIILIVLAVIFPPVAVALASQSIGKTILSLVLSCLFWIPGVIYALWIVLTNPAR